MKNYIKDGKMLTYAAGATILSGALHAVGGLVGVNAYDVGDGDSGELSLCGVYEVPKTEADTLAVGQAVYFDVSAGEVTEAQDSGANLFCGYCIEAAGNTATKAKILLVQKAYEQAAVVAFSAGSNLVGVDGTGSNAAPLAGTETRLDALDTGVAAIITALKNAGLMKTA